MEHTLNFLLVFSILFFNKKNYRTLIAKEKSTLSSAKYFTILDRSIRDIQLVTHEAKKNYCHWYITYILINNRFSSLMFADQTVGCVVSQVTNGF